MPNRKKEITQKRGGKPPAKVANINGVLMTRLPRNYKKKDLQGDVRAIEVFEYVWADLTARALNFNTNYFPAIMLSRETAAYFLSGEMALQTGGRVVDDARGATKINPWANLERKHLAAVVQLGNKLGVDTLTRVAMPVTAPEPIKEEKEDKEFLI